MSQLCQEDKRVQGGFPKRFNCCPVVSSIVKSSIIHHFLFLFGGYTVNGSMLSV